MNTISAIVVAIALVVAAVLLGGRYVALSNGISVVTVDRFSGAVRVCDAAGARGSCRLMGNSN